MEQQSQGMIGRAMQPQMQPQTGRPMGEERAAQSDAAAFKRPDIRPMIPAEQQDVFDRVVAAGMRVMYSPDFKDDIQQLLDAPQPTGEKIGMAVSGLMVMLDKQAKQPIPEAVITPAAMELVGEAAEVAAAAGQEVGQEDYNQALRTVFVVMSKKMGLSDEQIMQVSQQAMGGANGTAG